MKSTIRVDFQGPTTEGNGFEPVIRVNLIDSDDTRDKLLKTFFQSLGGESSWLKADFDGFSTGETHITLKPIKPIELKETIEIISERIK